MKIEVKCDHCGATMMRERKWVNRNEKLGHKMYCSSECTYTAQHISKSMKIEFNCAYCGKSSSTTPSEYKRSEVHFCSRSCRASYSNLGRRRNFTDGSASYREKAITFYGAKCSVCGYDIEPALEVHHKDGNRKNNEIENLDVLCPTHHKEYGLGIRTYNKRL